MIFFPLLFSNYVIRPRVGMKISPPVMNLLDAPEDTSVLFDDELRRGEFQRER